MPTIPWRSSLRRPRGGIVEMKILVDDKAVFTYPILPKHEGGATLDPEVARFIINSLRGKPKLTQPDKALSERELEVLELIGQGMAKKEIADRLDISITTVAYHVQHIYEKLKVPNAAAAVDRAHRLGLFPSD